MTSKHTEQTGHPEHTSGPRDPDGRKGAVEGNRPSDEQHSNPHGDGINEDGLPDDPVATAEDALGANEDESQG
jgi:hypothetical protein